MLFIGPLSLHLLTDALLSSSTSSSIDTADIPEVLLYPTLRHTGTLFWKQSLNYNYYNHSYQHYTTQTRNFQNMLLSLSPPGVGSYKSHPRT